MSFEMAQRATEVLLALAIYQQSLEHILRPQQGMLLFVIRAGLALLLLFGAFSAWVSLALLISSLFVLVRFQGPYNGGSDRMGLLIQTCLCLSHLLSAPEARELALGYLAIQRVLSYVMSGWVKLKSPEWRRGRALSDVFRFSAYPVSKSLRTFAHRPRLLRIGSWAVILFEILFPLSLFHPLALVVGLTLANLFHFANACLFGLNRFFWIWLAAYPSLLWLQDRIF